MPAFVKRLDQGQNTLVDDPRTDLFHDRGMVQFVETRRDIGLEHPVVIPGSESVLSATPRAETVADRFEIRLEDRLQHQQQRRLHRAVHRRGGYRAA